MAELGPDYDLAASLSTLLDGLTQHPDALAALLRHAYHTAAASRTELEGAAYLLAQTLQQVIADTSSIGGEPLHCPACRERTP